MICTSLINDGLPGTIGASPNKTQKRSAMISTSLIKIEPSGMIGASPNKTRKW